MASMDNSLDELLPKIGGFGLYQVYILTMICLSAGIVNPSIYMAFIFAARQNKHRCKIDQCDSKSSKYSEEWVEYAIPKDNNRNPEMCTRYVYTGGGGCNETDFDKSKKEICTEWVYDGDDYTILQKFNMQCSKNTYWFTLVGVINNLGQFFGLYLVGYIADRYGRRLIKVYIMLISGVIGVAKVLYPKLWWFLLMEFMDAMVGACSYICGFVLASEIMPLKWRALAGNIIGAVFAIGACYLVLIAYVFKNWWWIILIVHLPEFLVVSYLWIIPESIRWNLVNGRIEAAKKTLRKIAKVNKKELKDEELAVFDHLQTTDAPSKPNLKLAIQSRIMILRLLLCAFCWLANNFVYYGMIYNSVAGLSDNMYLDFILTSLVEIPAYFFIQIVVQVFGRKKSMVGSYAVSCTACSVFIFVPKKAWAKRSLWFIAKFSSTMSAGIIYIYTNELFPTSLRQAFMGTCSSIGRIGAMMAPVHPIFAQAWSHLPLILYAAVSGAAMLIMLFFFPETKNKKLPDTVQEAENLRNAPEIIIPKN